MATKILIVGNGAREHAVARALCMSKDVKLFAYMGALNPGIAQLCQSTGGKYALGDTRNAQEIGAWANQEKIELAFPSPDAVLEAGVSDVLIKYGVLCAAPTRAASRLEWDKAFTRQLMKHYRVSGCPKYAYFKSTSGLDGFIDQLGSVAIKPVGLTGGKGVKVSGDQLKTLDDAKKYARSVVSNRIGGQAAVLVEEKLEGEEFTLQAFVDGKRLLPMPCVQDHKRAFEGDKGPNTGGMGSYTWDSHLLPFMTATDYEQAAHIMKKLIRAFSLETGLEYRGILYGQFIATAEGVYLIESNARFGDPEAMNVLALLQTPLAKIFRMLAAHRLPEEIKWSELYTVVKYIVPKGYPTKPVPPGRLKINSKKLEASKAIPFYSSVDLREGNLYTGRSRSMAMLGVGETLEEAERKAEAGIKAISGPVWHRKDIGTRKLIEKRIEHMEKLRG